MDRGKPREQYTRTYILLPPSAGEAWARAVIDATWNDYRFTIGGSADDAGIGDLDVRRVIAVNPHEWPGDLVEFYREHYPGVWYCAINANTPRELEIELTLADSDSFDWVLIEQEQPPTPPPPSKFPIRGLHDLAGADWMLANGLRGWCLHPVYLNLDAKRLDYTRYEQAGIRVIVNLRYSYAVDDGGQGTIAPVHQLERFESAVVQTIYNCKGAWGYVYCNEQNNPREWPANTVITPAYYLASYNRVWKRLTPMDLLSPGAIDPYNPGWGDWRDTWREVLKNISGADFWALHAYSHGRYDDHDKKFTHAPLTGVFYNLRVLESQVDILPYERPVVVTECNHFQRDDGTIGWENDDTWARFAFDYLRGQGVDGVCLFRYGFDQWNIDNCPRVLEAVRDAG